MPLNGKRIFYIEDDIKNRSIVQLILERENVVFGFHHQGLNGLIEKLTAFMPLDLILLDLMFPEGVTGYKIFEIIRQHPQFDAVPLVVVSASDPSLEIPRARRLGFAGFISKPVNLITFPGYLRAILNGETVWV